MSTKVTISGSGLVGIGIEPATKLDLLSTGQSSGTNYTRNTVYNNTFDPPYWISRASRGTITVPSSILSGDTFGGFLFQGNYGTTANGTWKYGAAVTPKAYGDATTNGIPTYLRLAVSNGTTLLDTMYIHPVGVKIGAAYLHLAAGTAGAGTAPLKLTSGTLNTTPEAGAIEFDGTNLYFVNAAGSRQTLAVVA
jgi:hypothetical protein